MYEITQGLTEAAGMPAYEISNHAAPGAESRHNLVYWRQGDYAGVGPGAHGRVTVGGRRLATETLRAPEAWLETAAAPEGFACESVSAPDQAVEYLMMALRLAEGADLDRYARLAGAAPDPSRIAPLVQDGLLERRGARLAATAQGRPVLDALLRELLA